MTVKMKRKAYVDQIHCVACGCCEKSCPLGAVAVFRGIAAEVDPDKCVGCGKCVKACPASVIAMQEVNP